MSTLQNFQLHPRLQQDCIALGDFQLSRLLLMNDCTYPWFILVPTILDITELYQLTTPQQQQLTYESSYLAKQLATHYQADKMNIASIGNVVPQLHLHHIVRYRQDKAWPMPVWGAFPAAPYPQTEINSIKIAIKNILTDYSFQIC